MSEQLDDKLEQLLINKSFNSLSLVEKKYVLQLISEEEYDQYHLLLSKSLLALNSSEATLLLSSEIEQNLKRVFKTKYKKTFLRGIFSKRYTLEIPVYQPLLASIAVLLCIVFLINPFKIRKQQLVVQKMGNEKIIRKIPNNLETQKVEIAFNKSDINKVIKSGTITKQKAVKNEVIKERVIKKNTEIEIRDPAAITSYLCSAAFINQEELKRKMIDSATPCINVRLIIPETETYNGIF